MGKNKEKYLKLKGLIETIGDWNIKYLELSIEWDIPKSTIYRWRQEILKEMAGIDPKKVGFELYSALQCATKQIQLKLFEAKTISDVCRCARTICDLSQSTTDLLERYGLKTPIIINPSPEQFDSKILRVLKEAVPKETMNMDDPIWEQPL